MTKHVLVPIDESDQSKTVFEYALEEYPDEQITALHVIDPREFYSATGIESGITANAEQLQESFESQTERLLGKARVEAAERGVEIETDHETGRVANAIVSYADERDVDHIVMGSHGRSGASRILLGSVAETVTRRSPVSVTIVR